MRINSILVAAFLSICIVFFVAACGSKSGDDDDSSSAADDAGGDDSGDQNAYSPCEDTTRILAGVDDVSTILNISGADLLATVGTGFTTTAQYSSDTSMLTQSPSGAETNLTVTITYNSSEIREIESVPVQTQNEIAGECHSRLEMDVTIAFTTDDGAFAESWPAVLSQSQSADNTGLDNPNLAADFNPATLVGTFAILSIVGVAPDSVTGALGTTAVDPAQGSISILVQQTSGSGPDGTVSQSIHTALSWGAAQ